MTSYFGSPFHPGTLEDLFAMLESHDLDPHLAGPGCFAMNVRDEDGRPAIRFFGNFESVSFGFDFTTSDEQVITRLVAAFKKNNGYHRAVVRARVMSPSLAAAL